MHVRMYNYVSLFQVNGLACGFASLTSDVDLDVLKSCFDLEPFCGLRKVPPPEADTEPLKTGTYICTYTTIIM